MSALKELLKDVPVELETVADYIDYVQPNKYLVSSKNYHEDYKTPVLTAGKTFILGYTDENNGIFPASKTPVIIFDDFTTANKWVNFDFKAKSSAMKILIPKDDTKIVLKYFYYWLRSCPSELADGDHKRQWISNFSLKLFPIPYPNDPEKSLAVQQEIVRVLDELSEQNKTLTDALSQEIDNRKKQYAYYREELFRFEGKEVEWKTLGDIAIKISSGGTPKTENSSYYGGDIPWLRTQEVGYGDIWDTEIKITELGLKNSSAKLIPTNCVIIAMYGATVGRVGINKIPLATNQACANIEVDNKQADFRYIYHILLSQYAYIKSLGTGSQTNINAQIVKKLQIPIPYPNDPKKSLEIQQEIVRILDQYDEATKNIVSALEKEIDLRNKQYEYYRNLLLSSSAVH